MGSIHVRPEGHGLPALLAPLLGVLGLPSNEARLSRGQDAIAASTGLCTVGSTWYHSTPRHAIPCHAMPCHAMPCHATLRHVTPRYTPSPHHSAFSIQHPDVSTVHAAHRGIQPPRIINLAAAVKLAHALQPTPLPCALAGGPAAQRFPQEVSVPRLPQQLLHRFFPVAGASVPRSPQAWGRAWDTGGGAGAWAQS